MSHPNPHLAYRADIDGLRAVAVLAVVLFHAFPSWVPGGFIGVDIFFVISGYLISSILFKALAQGEFSFVDFYARRVRRIFPPLIVVVAFCLFLGWHVLLPDEYAQLGKHALAGLGFVANFVLWQEAGYFDNAAELKPLLHLWSLGIEEQFYIVWPALAVIAWRLGWGAGRIILVLGGVSLLASVLLTGPEPVASYFLPFTRAWELFAGAGLAWLVHQRRLTWAGARGADMAALVGAALIALGLVLIDKHRGFPGAWAMLPVGGAVLLISAGPRTWVNRHLLSNRMMVGLGLISFPLYLWHWPLLSFLRIVFPDHADSEWVLVSVLAAAVFFSCMSYWLVEKPIRRQGGRWVWGLIVSSLALAVVAGNLFVRDGWVFRLKGAQAKREAVAMEWPNSLRTDADCAAHFDKDRSAGWCMIADATRVPNAVIIGDSHANHYYWAFKDALLERSINLLQRAQGGCMPVRSADLFKEGRYLGCNLTTDAAFDYVLTHVEVKTVILAGRWGAYISRRELKDWATGAIEDQDVVLVENGRRREGLPSEEAFQVGLRQTLRELLQAGKRVVFLHTVPELDFNARMCVTWAPNAYVNRTPRPDCEVSRSLIEARNREFRPVLDPVLAEFPAVRVLDPHEVMCSERVCQGRQDDTLLYRDDDHLSLAGADWLGRRWRDTIVEAVTSGARP